MLLKRVKLSARFYVVAEQKETRKKRDDARVTSFAAASDMDDHFSRGKANCSRIKGFGFGSQDNYTLDFGILDSGFY